MGDCPTCKKCQGSGCAVDPAQDGLTIPDEVCKKCQGGNEVADAAKNDSACEDGPAVCDIDKCQNGTCAHTEVTTISAFGPPDSAPAGNLTADTSTALICLQDKVIAAGGGIIVGTTYRSQAYQEHLVEVWDKVHLLTGWSEAECDQVRVNHATEETQHFPMGAPARGISNHTLGTAFDATVSDLADSIIATLATECILTRPVANEPWHFER